MRRMFQADSNSASEPSVVLETGTLTSNTASVDVRFNYGPIYDGYEIRLNKVVPNQDDAIFFTRVSVSGGFGFATDTSYIYTAGILGTGGALGQFASGTGHMIVSRNQANFDMGNATGENGSFIFKVISPSVPTDYTTVRWEGAYVSSGTSSPSLAVWGTGHYFATMAVTAIRFLLNSGNFQRGTYEVIGHKNTV